MTLPPGQRAVEGFPRFGTHLSQPAPAVPPNHVIRIGGVVSEPFDLPIATLATLPRRELAADFHCVAGWSATGLRWEGVAFEEVYRTLIEPTLPAATAITHVVFGGLDRFRSVVMIEDALADDVLIADRLDGAPLGSDHGAPVRLVSPKQYGYINTKHLCRIDVRTSAPKGSRGRNPLHFWIRRHPRARVWQEERHPELPTWSVRPVNRLLIGPITSLCARGSREAD
ncbi:MAG: molybdopterin-dependent oxidoreductase [Nocardioides sp.]